eukprot:scaffold6249_cov119-Skeletonema_dohrnii-CCMP3373.AAC.1
MDIKSVPMAAADAIVRMLTFIVDVMLSLPWPVEHGACCCCPSYDHDYDPDVSSSFCAAAAPGRERCYARITRQGQTQ